MTFPRDEPTAHTEPPEPTAPEDPTRAYALVARSIAHLSTCAQPPTLSGLAEAMGLSPGHLQRVFQDWAGISPKRFLQFLTKERALAELRRGASVLQSSEEAGLSSAGRLHDLMVTWEAMTPGEARLGGRGLTLQWGWVPTPLGWGLAALSARGLCHFSLSDAPQAEAEQEMQALWPAARWCPDPAGVAAVIGRAFAEHPQAHLLLRGTPFQLKVWEALIRTEPGRVLSYSELARRCGHPKAARAVGTAVSSNTVAVLVPCHRVIRESAEIGQYRWGVARKQALQVWEARPELRRAV